MNPPTPTEEATEATSQTLSRSPAEAYSEGLVRSLAGTHLLSHRAIRLRLCASPPPGPSIWHKIAFVAAEDKILTDDLRAVLRSVSITGLSWCVVAAYRGLLRYISFWISILTMSILLQLLVGTTESTAWIRHPKGLCLLSSPSQPVTT